MGERARVPAAGKGSLIGKVAFVTGGASGIGLGSALALAREGADLVLFDNSADALREYVGLFVYKLRGWA